MHIVKYESPSINPVFFHSEIIDWNFQEKIIKDHQKYCFRFQLIFDKGIKENRQVGGFSTKKEAIQARNTIQAQLYYHEYSAFPSVTVKEYYDYYLYHHMAKDKKCAYGTFMSYRNIIYNYIVPLIGNRKLQSIKRSDLLKVLMSIQSKSVMKLAQGVITGSFKHAKAKNFISYDPSIGAVRDNKQRMRMEEKLHYESNEVNTKDEISVYSLKQVCYLLSKAKENKSIVFLPLLVSLTTGLRISELIALKFEDIDFEHNILYVKRQLGRNLEFVENEREEYRNQECSPKSHNGVRQIYLPQLTMDELILEQKRRLSTGQTLDSYIFVDPEGNHVHRSYYRKPYQMLLEQAHLPYIRWHDLRHTYATILYNNNISLKAISSSLGHGSEQLTKQVYIEEDASKQAITTLDYLKASNDQWLSSIDAKDYLYDFDLPWENYLNFISQSNTFDMSYPWEYI